MHPLRALIVDKDEDFADRVQRCLRAAGIESDTADSRRATLELVAERRPSILFIAVEQPRRSGFALFSDVKRLDRQARVVLVTATVPMADLLLHQKLRIHADAYLDKRQLDERGILEALDRLLSLGLDDAELRRMAREAAAVPPARRGARPSLAKRAQRVTAVADDDDGAEPEDLEPALTTLLAELGVDAPERAAAAHDPDPSIEIDPALDEVGDDEDVAESEEQHELRERVAQLERELDIARQAARSSPFSSDYLTLSERADHGERHAARLRRDADARSRQAERLRDKLVQVAARLVESERARRGADELGEKLESRLSAADCALEQARQRLADVERHGSVERERSERDTRSQAGAIEELRRELVEAQQRAVKAALDVEAAHADEMATLARRHAEALERERAQLAQEQRRLVQEHEASLREQAAKLGRQSIEVLEAREAELQRRLDEQRQAQAQVADELREAHRRELNELHDSLEQALTRKERQMAAELLAVTDEHEQKLERSTAEWQTRLDQAHGALHSESAEVLAAHRHEIGEIERRHREALAELRTAHSAASEQLRGEHAARESEVEREAARALAAEQAAGQARLEEARTERERALEAQRVEHGREKVHLLALHEHALAEQAHRHAEALSDAMAEMREERSREGGQRLTELEEAERKRRADLAEVEQRYRDEIDLLRKLHEVELERLDVRHTAERERMLAERELALEELSRSLPTERERAPGAGLDVPPLEPAPPPGRDEIRRAIEALDADPDF